MSDMTFEPLTVEQTQPLRTWLRSCLASHHDAQRSFFLWAYVSGRYLVTLHEEATARNAYDGDSLEEAIACYNRLGQPPEDAV